MRFDLYERFKLKKISMTTLNLKNQTNKLEVTAKCKDNIFKWVKI